MTIKQAPNVQLAELMEKHGLHALKTNHPAIEKNIADIEEQLGSNQLSSWNNANYSQYSQYSKIYTV